MGERTEDYATELEAALDAFISRVEGLTEEQWRRPGRNYPQQLNGEDENRPVGVIAHHVADSGPLILARTQALATGTTPPPLAGPVAETNARHAREHASVNKEDVLALLREQRVKMPAALRALPDEALDLANETPAGRLSVADRIERVLIGHIRMHLGSIEAAVAE
jgi:DinB superfamily